MDFIVANEEHGHRVGRGKAGVQGIDEPGVYGEREWKGAKVAGAVSWGREGASVTF